VPRTPRTSSRTCGSVGRARTGRGFEIASDSWSRSREVSVGEWLPEHDAATIDPQLRAEHSEAIAVALDLLLARLSPVERAVYVLREAFAYPFREIGEALEISEANARQVARRARIHLAEQRHESVDSAERDELLESFLDAARAGNVAGLIDMLVNAVDTKSASTRCHAVLDRAKLRTSRPTVAVRARCATPADAAHPQR
jgi:hypothetical protein